MASSLQLEINAGSAVAAESGFWRVDANASGWRMTDASGNTSNLVSALDVLDVPGTQGESLVVGDSAFLDTGTNTWFKIDNDATGPIKNGLLRGMVSNASPLKIRIKGKLGGLSSLTPGARIYASGTAGGITHTKPTVSAGGGQKVSLDMGFALSATEMWVEPAPAQYVKRDTLAVGASLTLEHHADLAAYGRRVFAEINTYTGALSQSYSTSNQDTVIALRGPAGPGAGVTVDSAGATLQAIGNIGGTSYNRAAQQFVPTATGPITQFTVFHGANLVGTPSGTITYSFHKDNGGFPSENAFFTGTYTPTASANNTVNITNGPLAVVGQLLWLRLQSTATQASGVAWQVQYSTANPYTSGAMKADNGSFTNYNKAWIVAVGANADLRCTVTTGSQSRFEAIAQSTSLASTLNVLYVNLYLCKVGAPVHDLILTIKADSAGSPGSAITNGTSRTIRAEDLSLTLAMVRFDFDIGPSMTASTTHWLELSTTDGGDMLNYVVWGIDKSSPGHSPGELRAQLPSGTWQAQTADGCFEIYTQDVAYTTIVPVGLWDGTDQTDIGVIYGDSAAASPTTKTTIINNGAATRDVTLRVVA